MSVGRRSVGLAVLLAAAVAQADFVDHTDVFEPVFNTSLLSHGPGVGFIDFDGDGDDDVVVSQGTDGVRLYENGGAPEFDFSDVTEDVGLATAVGFAFGLAAADLDRDGDSELLVADRTYGLRVFRNGGGFFDEVTALAGTYGSHTLTSIAVGDIDGDGWTDVWATGGTHTYSRRLNGCADDRLYRNQHDGSFQEVAAAWGAVDAGCGLAVAFSDFDRDGDADVLIANDFGQYVSPNKLFRNDGWSASGEIILMDASSETGFDVALYGMGIAFADLDENGWSDYFVTNIGRSVLLLGGPDGFLDATEAYGVQSEFSYNGFRSTWGATFLDLEQDGIWDLSVASGWVPTAQDIETDLVQPSLLFTRLTGGTPSEDEGITLGAAPEDSSHGLALGDFDADGDDDLLTAALGGLVHLYRNDGASGPVARVRLQGTVSNTDALGALLTLRCGLLRRTRELQTGGSYASMHSLEVRIPLAGCDEDAELEIRWPSGLVEAVPVGPGSTLIDRVEPEWLTVDPPLAPADGSSAVSVTVTPLGPDGAARGPGLDVEISSTAGTVGPVIDRGDGSYGCSLVAPSEPRWATLSLTVDGVTVAAHPRVPFFEISPSTLSVSPDPFVEGMAASVSLVPRAADGSARGPGLAVALDATGGSIGPVTDMGDGRYEASLEAEGTGSVQLEAREGAVLLSPPIAVDAVAPIDPTKSVVTLRPRGVLRSDLETAVVEVRVSSRTGTGFPIHPIAGPVTILGRSGVLPPTSDAVGTPLNNAYTAQFEAATLATEGALEIRVQGVVLADRPGLRVFDAPEEVVAEIDPARSRIAVQRTLRADGEDSGRVFAYLFDAGGQPLPWIDGLAVASEGVSIFEEEVVGFGTELTARARAGRVLGPHRVEVLWEGAPTGIVGELVLVAPSTYDLDRLTVETCLEPGQVSANGKATSRLLVRARNPDGFLVGSNVPVAVRIGAEPQRLDYGALAATYSSIVQARVAPEIVPVETELVGTGRSSATSISFFDPGAQIEPETTCVEIPPLADQPDAGVGPDAGSGVDGGSDGGARLLHPRGGGCACGVLGEAPDLALFALACAGGIALRRRA